MDQENAHKDMSNHYVKNDTNRYTEAYMKYKATMRKFDATRPNKPSAPVGKK